MISSVWFFGLYLGIGACVVFSWIILRTTRPLSRRICRGSALGIGVGGLIGAVLGALSLSLFPWDLPLPRDALFGPALVLGALFGSTLGALIRPAPKRETVAGRLDLSDEVVDTIPRWSEAVDHFDRFKTAKKRVIGTRPEPGPSEPNESA